MSLRGLIMHYKLASSSNISFVFSRTFGLLKSCMQSKYKLLSFELHIEAFIWAREL